MKRIFSGNKLLQNIILIAIAAYFVFLLVSQQKTLDRNIGEYEKINAALEQISEENEMLERELETADSDEYLEKKIRDILGYVKPDETVFIEK